MKQGTATTKLCYALQQQVKYSMRATGGPCRQQMLQLRRPQLCASQAGAVLFTGRSCALHRLASQLEPFSSQAAAVRFTGWSRSLHSTLLGSAMKARSSVFTSSGASC
jgi:hypothetical protein